MNRIYRQRSQYGVNGFLKVAIVVVMFFGGQLVALEKEDIIFLESGNEVLFPNPVHFAHHLTNSCGNRGQLFARSHPVGARKTQMTLTLLLEARDPHFKELIQICGDDTQEPKSFQQWITRVVRFLQNTLMILQEAKLAVVVERRVG
jgi:hypothetical protein